MTLDIGRLGPADLEGALRLSTQAGWNQLAADWQRLFDLCPEGCLAGRQNGKLVATATVASFGRDVHWIGMVLVDEALRGQGIGSKMLSHTIQLAQSRGGVVGLDATDLGRPVYLKQGFVDVAPIDRWSGVLKAPAPVAAAKPIDRSCFDDVATLDRAAAGCDRSALLLHLMQEPGVYGVAEQGAGYAFLRPGRNAFHVGPMVSVDDSVAAKMLGSLARLVPSAPVLLDALRTSASTALLDAFGLGVSRRLTRMTHGSSSRVLMGDPVRAAVSFELG